MAIMLIITSPVPSLNSHVFIHTHFSRMITFTVSENFDGSNAEVTVCNATVYW